MIGKLVQAARGEAAKTANCGEHLAKTVDKVYELGVGIPALTPRRITGCGRRGACVYPPA